MLLHDCPFRDVVFEAIKELEETKSKFSEITEKVKYCEYKLNNVLTVMLKCDTLALGTSSRHQIRNETCVLSNNLPVNDCSVSVHTVRQTENSAVKVHTQGMPLAIKAEPLELNEREEFSSPQTRSITFSFRNNFTNWNSFTPDDHSDEVPSKRLKIGSSELKGNNNCGKFDLAEVRKTEHNYDNEIVVGRVIPVVGADNLSKEPDEGPDCLHNERSTLAAGRLFSQLTHIICQRTLDALKFIGFTMMTEVQAQVIQPFLSGRNLVVSSRRGSGKTIAFLVPAIEIIYRLNFRPCDGTGCVILCETNELVMQTYGVLMGLMQYHQLTFGTLLQKHSIKAPLSEKDMLSQGVNILVSTPTKLLECLSTSSINVCKLQCVIVDGIDTLILKNGKAMKRIFDLLPGHKQIALFTASVIPYSEYVEQLLGPKTSVVTVISEGIVPEGLENYYMQCEAMEQTFVIFKLLEKWQDCEKVVVVFRSPRYVKYFGLMLPKLGVPVYTMNYKYGNEEQINTFLAFCATKTGILLCTLDLCMGLDIPAVSWVILHDCSSAEDCIRSAGLTARGIGGKGKSLVLLQPAQKFVIDILQKQGIFIQEYTFADVEIGIKPFYRKLRVLVRKDELLKKVAARAASAKSQPRKQLSLNLSKAFGLKNSSKTCNSQEPKEKLKSKKKTIEKVKKKKSKNSKPAMKRFKGTTAQHLH